MVKKIVAVFRVKRDVKREKKPDIFIAVTNEQKARLLFYKKESDLKYLPGFAEITMKVFENLDSFYDFGIGEGKEYFKELNAREMRFFCDRAEEA